MNADALTTLHRDMGVPGSVPRVLSIAGTDPSGGAGIHADLKSIAACGGYGMAAVSALTAQNTRGVVSVHVPPVSFLRDQLQAISDDITVDAVKTGMLFNTEIIQTVQAWLEENRPPVVVMDPVMVATSGDRLLQTEAEQAVRDLLPVVDLITPNVPELAVLLQEEPATSQNQLIEQAQRLAERTGVLVLAKGGHLTEQVVKDVLVGADGPQAEATSPRLDVTTTHGTGCSLSAALATLRARRGDWGQALTEAKAWLSRAVQDGGELQVGGGHGPVSHFAALWEAARS